MGCLDEIKNLEYFKQMVLEDVCFYKTFVIDYPYLKNFKTDVYIDVPEDNIESLINPYTNKNKDKIFNNVHYTFNNNTNYYIKSCIIKDNVIMDVFPLIKEIELSLIK